MQARILHIGSLPVMSSLDLHNFLSLETQALSMLVSGRQRLDTTTDFSI